MARRARLLTVWALLLLASTSARAGALWEATWLQATQGVPMTRTFLELGASGGIFNSGASIGVSLSYPAFATTLFVPKTPNGTLTLGYRISQGGPQLIFATSGWARAPRASPAPSC
jgi:hypothetical protein